MLTEKNIERKPKILLKIKVIQSLATNQEKNFKQLTVTYQGKGRSKMKD